VHLCADSPPRPAPSHPVKLGVSPANVLINQGVMATLQERRLGYLSRAVLEPGTSGFSTPRINRYATRGISSGFYRYISPVRYPGTGTSPSTSASTGSRRQTGRTCAKCRCDRTLRSGHGERGGERSGGPRRWKVTRVPQADLERFGEGRKRGERSGVDRLFDVSESESTAGRCERSGEWKRDPGESRGRNFEEGRAGQVECGRRMGLNLYRNARVYADSCLPVPPSHCLHDRVIQGVAAWGRDTRCIGMTRRW
jgi:hypothetical protein